MKTVTISSNNNPLVLGSKVTTPDGHEVPGVKSVTLEGSDPNSYWEAKIVCVASIDQLEAIPFFDFEYIKRQVIESICNDPESPFFGSRKLVEQHAEKLFK